jgi:hypothetical protein
MFQRYNLGLMIYFTFNSLMSSSVEGHFHLRHLLSLALSPMSIFQIWVSSYQSLLRYFTFIVLRPSSYKRSSSFEAFVKFFSGHLSLCFEFG